MNREHHDSAERIRFAADRHKDGRRTAWTPLYINYPIEVASFSPTLVAFPEAHT
jgi:hypothetical protein